VRTPARLIIQPLTGDGPEIVAVRNVEGLYRVASFNSRRGADDASADGISIKPSAKLRARRFQSIEDLEAAVASELSRRRAVRGTLTLKLTSTAARDKSPRGQPSAARHPQWLDREMAQILERNGYRHYPSGGFYVADQDCRITETQLLVSEPESLRELIARQRAASRRR
jgi:hypothetical protein